MKRRSFLLSAALLLASVSRGADSKLPNIGPGSEISFDKGYYPQKGWEWVPLPTTLVVVGEEDVLQAALCRRPPCLVCVEKGDRLPYGEFFLLRKDRLAAGQVLKAVPGKLLPMRTVVENP